jgi:hypothetical protein
MAEKIILKTIGYPYSDEFESGYVRFSVDGLDNSTVMLKKHNSNCHHEITSYSRYLMEVHLGRFLEKQEKVYHIDKNRLNFNIDNLEVRKTGSSSTINQPIKQSPVKSRKPILVELTCAYCKQSFTKEANLLSASATNRFCCKGCQYAFTSKFGKASNNVFRTANK